MKVVPQSFYADNKIEKVLRDGLSCVLIKEVSQANGENNRYLATHALTLVLSGKLRIVDHDGRGATIHENQMVFMPKGIYLISDIIPNEAPFKAMVFFFDEGLIQEFQPIKEQWVRAENTPGFIQFNASADINHYCDSLLALYKGGTNHAQVTNVKLMELLHLLKLLPEGDVFLQSLGSLSNRPKRSLKSLMQAHFDKPFTIEDFAYLSGRSISSFHRDFKTIFGLSPKKWLIDQKMDRAYSLFTANENLKVSEVAQKVGYENLSYFIYAFQKRFQISPKQLSLKSRQENMVRTGF